jgi:hypothetical protein
MWLALTRKRTVRPSARFSGLEKALCAVQFPRLVCPSWATRLMPLSCQADKSGLIDLLDRHLSCSCGRPWSESGVKRKEGESCTSQPANITLGFPWLIFNCHGIEGENELIDMQKYLLFRLYQRMSHKCRDERVSQSQNPQSAIHQILFQRGVSTGTTAQGWLFGYARVRASNATMTGRAKYPSWSSFFGDVLSSSHFDWTPSSLR